MARRFAVPAAPDGGKLGVIELKRLRVEFAAALMDRLAEGCTEAEYRRLEEIFVNCSRYELGFWEMAWTLEK